MKQTIVFTGDVYSPGEMDVVRQVVIQVGECNLVLCSDWLPDNDLVNVIELVPVFIPAKKVQKIEYCTQNTNAIYNSVFTLQAATSLNYNLTNVTATKLPTWIKETIHLCPFLKCK